MIKDNIGGVKLIKRREGFLQGAIYLMISQVIIKMLGMIYSLYLTNKRGFGDEGNAICMSGFQIYALFLGICSFGVPNAISKMISENIEIGNEGNCRKIIKISLIVFTTIGFLFCLVLYFLSEFIANKVLYIEASSDILKILAPSIVFSTVEAVFRGYFNGVNKISISAKIAILEQILKTVFTIGCVEFIGRITNFDTELMAKGSMLSASIATISSFLYSFIQYKRINKKEKINLAVERNSTSRILKELFSILIPISITSVLMILENNIDSVTIVRILKNKIGEVEARKIYGIIASKVNLIINLPLALNGAISISLIPEISRNIIKSNKLKLEKSINFSILVTFLISVPIMLGIIFYSEEIMKFLYPNAPRGAELLKLGATTIVFACITQNISGILQGAGNSKTHLYAVSIGIAFKFLLNIVLISNNKILENGAIISTLVSNIIIFYIMYKKLKKTFDIKFSFYLDFIKIFFVSFISILAIKFIFKNIFWNFRVKFLSEIINCVIIYFVIIFILICTKRIEIVKKDKIYKKRENALNY